ncbi:MAG: CheR family methyltransferase [Janthinobacterium lividum]
MHLAESSRPAASPLAAPVLSAAGYAHLVKFIYTESGIALGPEKQYLLESRLLPIIRQEQIASLDALATLLMGKPSSSLRRLVVEAMTTHETLFFRDPVMFEALRKEVMPGLFGKLSGGRKLRIWSAAASSGQEAYSLAMLALELGKDASDVEILGTDLSTQVLERAREGTYGTFEIGRGVSSSLLLRYFDKKGSDSQIKEHVRRMVRFEQRDLRADVAALGAC